MKKYVWLHHIIYLAHCGGGGGVFRNTTLLTGPLSDQFSEYEFAPFAFGATTLNTFWLPEIECVPSVTSMPGEDVIAGWRMISWWYLYRMKRLEIEKIKFSENHTVYDIIIEI